MMKFLKSFMAFYRGFAPCVTVEIDDDDRKFLQLYLLSRSGARILNNLQAQSFEQDRVATLQTSDPRWHAGVATGYRMAIAQIQLDSFVQADAETLSEATSAQAGNHDEEDESATLRFDQNNR